MDTGAGVIDVKKLVGSGCRQLPSKKLEEWRLVAVVGFRVTIAPSKEVTSGESL